MIKKLRIKFVVINMTIVTIMLVIILSLVFCFTEVQMGSQSIRMMQRLMFRPASVMTPDQIDDDIRLPFFAIRLGPDGERISVVGSYYDLSNEAFLDDVISKAKTSGSRTGELDKYNLRYCFVDTPHSDYLLFSDTSSEKAALNSLMKICILLGLGGFLVFLAISIPLSGWAVKPVSEAMQQQRQFIADASHELKTPLTVLMTNAQLIRSPSCTEDRQKKCVDGILVMSHQMKALIEQLLELARIDAAAAKEPSEILDLSKLLKDAVLPFEPLFFERELTLETDIQPNIQINGYAQRIRQLLEILLDNAQKYSSPGGKTTVQLQRQFHGRCILSVSNEGAEIPADQLNQLFKRFYRADEARTRTGSFGLGLSIAEAIVGQHHGKIHAESKNGINSFTAEFPSI